MAFSDMIGYVRGEVGKISSVQVRKQINNALGAIYDENLWSFQLQEGGWLAPGLIGPIGATSSAGSITVTPYATTITGDATASALWTGFSGRPLITELQIRVPYYSLYNIIGIDATVPTAVVLTIDRPWTEPSQTNQGYMMYQAYFPVPVAATNFKGFFAIRDPRNAQWIDYWSLSQNDLSLKDPQRTIFNIPCFAVPYKVDDRPNSASLGAMLWELWPHPLSQWPYTINYKTRGTKAGAELVNRTDTVPYPLTDDLVQWRAVEYACLWKERQKGEDVARGSGADFKFGAQAAHDEYMSRLKKIRITDRSLCDLYFNRIKPRLDTQTQPYATYTGLLNVGRF